jgi:hypothetical protein
MSVLTDPTALITGVPLIKTGLGIWKAPGKMMRLGRNLSDFRSGLKSASTPGKLNVGDRKEQFALNKAGLDSDEKIANARPEDVQNALGGTKSVTSKQARNAAYDDYRDFGKLHKGVQEGLVDSARTQLAKDRGVDKKDVSAGDAYKAAESNFRKERGEELMRNPDKLESLTTGKLNEMNGNKRVDELQKAAFAQTGTSTNPAVEMAVKTGASVQDMQKFQDAGWNTNDFADRSREEVLAKAGEVGADGVNEGNVGEIQRNAGSAINAEMSGQTITKAAVLSSGGGAGAAGPSGPQADGEGPEAPKADKGSQEDSWQLLKDSMISGGGGRRRREKGTSEQLEEMLEDKDETPSQR